MSADLHLPLPDDSDDDLGLEAPLPPGSERPRPEAGDLDAMEAADRGVHGEDARIAAAFDDPDAVEPDPDEVEAERQEEAEEALAAPDTGRSVLDTRRGDELQDAFEAWAKVAQRHPPLSYAETDHLLALAQGRDPQAPAQARAYLEARRDDPHATPQERDRVIQLIRHLAPFEDEDVRARATELLARHNVKWVIRCLRERVGPQVMNTPSDLRNDLLQQGNLGFLKAIEKYDHEAAQKNGGGHKKGFLEFARFWINNRVNKFTAKERFGLTQEQAEDRKKILDALGLVKKDMESHGLLGEQAVREARRAGATDGGRSVAETLQERRREQVDVIDLVVQKLEAIARRRCLEEDGIADPTTPDLRRRGALVRDRVEDLLAHSTSTLSLDQPSDDDGDATLGQLVGAAVDDEGALVEDATAQALRDALDTAPMEFDRLQLLMFAAGAGMLTSTGRARFGDLSAEDIARLGGKTRDSVLKYETQISRAIQGFEPIEPDQLRRPRVPVTAAEAAERLASGAGLEATTLRRIRQSLSLREVLEASGVQFPDVDTDLAVACPFEDGAAGHFEVLDDERYCCSVCGAEGDVFSWLSHRDTLCPNDAIVAAVRLANALPVGTEEFTENGRTQVAVVQYPKRHSAVRRSL